MKKLIIPEIKTCYECPWLVNTGREDPWCGKNHESMDYDEEEEDFTFEIPKHCELEESAK